MREQDQPGGGEPVRERASVTADGVPLARLPHGVSFRDAPTHLDERGSIVELYGAQWDWHPDPLVFVYCFTIRPGMIKGWGLHKLHEDRYFVLQGEMEVVFYDERPDSPTRGLVSKVVLSGYRRRLMNIPAGIWHANRNLGQDDVVVINFPTIAYDHANPDKYRLPLDTDRIPYRFDQRRGF
jgi:dTDP-4-dehydrorhamnose 3,5-epimerase